MRRLLLFLILLTACNKDGKRATVEVVKDPASPVFDAEFWKTWSDGNAELTSYTLQYPRYGKPRDGTAVAIFVTETFANSLRVKSDPGARAKKDEFPVMKLNLVEDFQTGLYDYNLMLQAFVAMEAVNGRPAGVPTKIAWSSQEWCGNLFKQALFDTGVVRVMSHSYFDGEGDQEASDPSPQPAVASEDALMPWARGMAWPVVKAGESKTVPVLLALQQARFKKGPWQWGKVTLARASKPSTVKVPSGEFTVEEMSATFEDGRKRSYWVQQAAPHRVVVYSTSDGIRAEMLATERMKYWQLNMPEGAKELTKLKLQSRPPRTM